MEDLSNVFNIEELENLLFKKILTESFKAEHSSVYYKAFKVGDLFKRRVIRTTGIPIKELDISEKISTKKTLRVISGSKNNNGVIGYIAPQKNYLIENNKISIANVGTPGVCFYHNYNFAAFTDTAVIDFTDNELYNNMNEKAYQTLALYFTKIYANSLHPAFVRWISAGNDFSREIILLPCYRDADGIEHISVKTLEYLYNRTKFNEYKTKIEKLERERSSIQQSLDLYKNNIRFEEEKKKIFYRAFRVGELIQRSTRHMIKSSAKNIDYIEKRDEHHTIGNTGMTASNNGIVNYVSENDEINKKKIKDCITVSPGGNGTAGAFFYQPDYIISTGNNNLVEFLNKTLEVELKNNKAAFKCFARILTISLKNKFHCFARGISIGNDFSREIILLPCYEDNTISTSKLEELYHKSVIKSKENQISERESNQCSCGTFQGISNSNIKISVDMLGYLYLRIQVKQFNEKEKQLQEEITSSF